MPLKCDEEKEKKKTHNNIGLRIIMALQLYGELRDRKKNNIYLKWNGYRLYIFGSFISRFFDN